MIYHNSSIKIDVSLLPSLARHTAQHDKTKLIHEQTNKQTNKLYTLEIKEIVSPLSRTIPNVLFLLGSLTFTSTASSTTKFMNSSKPLMTPLILTFACLYNHIDTGFCCWRYLKIWLIGGTLAVLCPAAILA